MNHRPRRAWPIALAAAIMIAGCGVDSEDEPQPIEDTTRESGLTPSVDTRPGPTPTIGTTTSAPSVMSTPSTPTSSGS